MVRQEDSVCKRALELPASAEDRRRGGPDGEPIVEVRDDPGPTRPARLAGTAAVRVGHRVAEVAQFIQSMDLRTCWRRQDGIGVADVQVRSPERPGEDRQGLRRRGASSRADRIRSVH